jgi:hypothetical protein
MHLTFSSSALHFSKHVPLNGGAFVLPRIELRTIDELISSEKLNKYDTGSETPTLLSTTRNYYVRSIMLISFSLLESTFSNPSYSVVLESVYHEDVCVLFS